MPRGGPVRAAADKIDWATAVLQVLREEGLTTFAGRTIVLKKQKSDDTPGGPKGVSP